MPKKLPSTQAGRRKLLKLADMLEADSRKRTGIKFDLGTWGEVANTDRPVSCGTKACPMGLAALSGKFAGLSFWLSQESLYFEWHGKKLTDGCQVAAELFDIDRYDAGFLFYASNYGDVTEGAKAERAVAKRIRDFAAGRVSRHD